MPRVQITWVPPDGGWGWVIVVCSLMLHLHVTAIMYALSVMYIPWLETFGQGRGVTSWVISIGVAVMFGSAPLPAALANRYGFRVVVIVGGLLTSAGYILSFFATSVSYLIVSIGLIAGLGSSLGYLSAVAIVSVYFDKRRPIAMGIATTGASIGALVLGPLVDYLINIYGWRGTILIIGGASLHMCAYGLLLRPLKIITVNEETCVEVKDKCVDDEVQSLVFHETNSDKKEDEIGLKNSDIVQKESSNDSLIYHSTAMLRSDSSPMKPKTFLDGLEVGHDPVNVFNLVNFEEIHAPRNSRMSWQEKTFKRFSYVRSYTSLKDIDSNTNFNRQNHQNSMLKMDANKSQDAIFASSVRHLDKIILIGSPPTHLSSCSINDKEDDGIKDEEIDVFDPSSDENNVKNIYSCLSLIKTGVIDSFQANLDLLKDPMFLQFALSNFLVNLSYIIPVVYFVDRAEDEGVGRSIGALLISFCGCGGVVGRFFFGSITYFLFKDRLMTFIVGLSLAGSFTMLSPLCGSNAYLHCVYAALIGGLLGGYSTLAPVVTTELMGFTRASESYGLLLAFMGVATVIGPPFAGLLFDWTRSYTFTYILFGFFLAISGLMLVPAYCVRRRNNKRERNLEEKNDRAESRATKTEQ